MIGILCLSDNLPVIMNAYFIAKQYVCITTDSSAIELLQ